MNKNKKLLIIIVVLVLVLGLAGWFYTSLSKDYQPTSNSSNAQQDAQEETIFAPNFTVYNEKGEKVTLHSLKGKPIILNFWASWCGNCKMEMPYFQDMYEKYGDEIHFVMVDMVDDQRETQEIGSAFVKENGFTFPVYYDNDLDVAMNYGIYALPTTFFLNDDLSLVQGYTGALSYDVLQANIERLMK